MMMMLLMLDDEQMDDDKPKMLETVKAITSQSDPSHKPI